MQRNEFSFQSNHYHWFVQGHSHNYVFLTFILTLTLRHVFEHLCLCIKLEVAMYL